MKLSQEQIEQFKADGFIAIPNFIDSTTVAELRDYYDRILRREIELATDRMLGDVIRQVMVPSRSLPYFRDNPALANGREVAKQLLDTGEVNFFYDMLISKAPGDTLETPWHQDNAYAERPFAPAGLKMSNRAVQIWVALDDVDAENGCMHFIPGAHREPLLPHYVASGDPNEDNRLLATDVADTSKAIACPLAAGGCTIHLPGTLHYTSGNRTSDRLRRAYIFNYVRPNTI